jgi:hypothetical protein
MAYGVSTRMYLASEPERPRAPVPRDSGLWRQLRADERLCAVERLLRPNA